MNNEKEKKEVHKNEKNLKNIKKLQEEIAGLNNSLKNANDKINQNNADTDTYFR